MNLRETRMSETLSRCMCSEMGLYLRLLICPAPLHMQFCDALLR